MTCGLYYKKWGLDNILDIRTSLTPYWAQWNSLVVRDGMLECHWESTDRRTETTQIIVPQSKAKEVLAELHG
jgi:hypothetical protein